MPPLHNLEKYLNKPVSDLVAPLPIALTEEAKERHRIFSILLMAITGHYWNGMKDGRAFRYPLNPSKEQGDIGRFLEDDYHGHNIACLAVDLNGKVIDFEFNHNELFSSSAEHAEARLVRRVFSLAQVNDGEATGATWELAQVTQATSSKPVSYATLLSGVSLYTTLESCSQCSGIMALGQVKEIVYLQRDPGMYFIGNILRRLTEKTGLQAPLPIPGEDIGLPAFKLLNEGYDGFAGRQTANEGEPFKRKSDGSPLWSTSITSYLCTREPYLIFSKTQEEFQKMVLQFPEYRPEKENMLDTGQKVLTNQQALDRARKFFEYATLSGKRGTPHRV